MARAPRVVRGLPGGAAPRVANTSCLSFGTLDAERVLTKLERAGVIASSGAACSAGGTQPSHVLMAMGLGERAARRGVRFSLGRDTTDADIDTALAAATATLAPLPTAQPPQTVAYQQVVAARANLDRVGITCASGRHHATLPAVRGKGRIFRVFEFLRSAPRGGPTDIRAMCSRVSAESRQPGLTVVEVMKAIHAGQVRGMYSAGVG